MSWIHKRLYLFIVMLWNDYLLVSLWIQIKKTYMQKLVSC